ncbi:MAG: BREX-1 system phosphatase PglZ type A [Saprospiraceae bacterium]|nr:BREX-1 system phosphatase PglZ type A [Saprospiraceae bacterium]
MAEDLKVASLLQSESLELILQDDLFRVIDLKIIHELTARLLSREISLDNLLAVLKTRATNIGTPTTGTTTRVPGTRRAVTHQSVARAQTSVESVEEAAMQYAGEGHLVDFHYRKFIYHHRQARQDGVLNELLDKVVKVYSNDWLLPLNNQLQDHLNSLGQWPYQSQKAQRRFFENHVKNVAGKNTRLFVVISDALRYENGWELCKEILAENRYDAEMDYLITGLPSYTQLGMAALLPHRELSIQDGKDTVLADGMSTAGTQARTKVLETNAGMRAVAIRAEDFMKMNTKLEGRPFVMQYDLIYIYHNRIDKTGDDKTTEDKVFEAVEEEIAFLKELLRKIANVNGYNIVITSDHGYIYQHDALDESEFSESEVQGEAWKVNRRFILAILEASSALKKFSGEQVGLSGDAEVLVTKGINRLRVKGAGSRYIHGGASLQEIVVPLPKVTKRREDTTSQVEIDIIKSTDKITTNLLAVSFLQKELVTDKVQLRRLGVFLRRKTERCCRIYTITRLMYQKAVKGSGRSGTGSNSAVRQAALTKTSGYRWYWKSR